MKNKKWFNAPNLRIKGNSHVGGVAEVEIEDDQVTVKLSQTVGGTNGTEWVHDEQKMDLESFNKYVRPLLVEA